MAGQPTLINVNNEHYTRTVGFFLNISNLKHI